MKSRIIILLLVIVYFSSCGASITVCECLKDDGSHKKECDELGNRMSKEEMRREISKCK